MLKTRIILLVVSALIIWLIFMLPKVVVENEDQLKEPKAAPTKEQAKADPHQAVPSDLALHIKSVKAQFDPHSQNQKNAIFADSLSGLYSKAGQFDSAGWYAEKAATFLQTKESFLKAGNYYYEAYTFAMDADKQNQLAEKTREWLSKVIETDASNLEAKTKVGMTYVNSSSPMQGIKMLREVLEQDPKNEFALYNMGMLSLQSGQYGRAIERFEELVGINPKHTQAQLLLGVAYLNEGKKEKALQQFEKVKQMDADPAVQATVDSYLNDLKK